jgi:methanogenic corrinoid protein MtbC1
MTRLRQQPPRGEPTTTDPRTGHQPAVRGEERTAADPDRELNLKQVAAALEVHYMTVYRYIRTGRLVARRSAAGWGVKRADLAAFAAHRAGSREGSVGTGSEVDWRDRLRRTLVVGDEPAAWRVLELALAAGFTPLRCYLDLLVGAVDDIRAARPPWGPVAEECLATVTATRLVARLGARFRRPGRRRGTVVVGAPQGEHHALPNFVVADLVRLAGFDCLELGADVPPEAFASAAARAHRLVAVKIETTTAQGYDAACHTIKAIQDWDPGIPILRDLRSRHL